MASDLQSARDDLAYMRTLVSGSGAMQSTIGEAFIWAGALYGGQCLLHGLQTLGCSLRRVDRAGRCGAADAAFLRGVGAHHLEGPQNADGGVASRALGAVFQGAGLANLVMAFVFAYGPQRAESIVLWLYQPIVVCMFQGVAWYVAYAILRHAWLGLVALGWFA